MDNKLASLLFILIPFLLSAQEGYFKTDSTMSVGVDIVFVSPAFNSRYCRVIENKQATNYTPYQVTEYAINDRKFMATDIDLRGKRERVFLEQLVEGKATLYYYEDSLTKIYFIEKHKGKIIPITEYNSEKGSLVFIQEIESAIADNPYAVTGFKQLKTKQYHLKWYIKKYNSGKDFSFPEWHFGGAVGAGTILIHPHYTVKEHPIQVFPFKPEVFYSAECFLTIPLYLTNFSIPIYFGIHKYNSNQHHTIETSSEIVSNQRLSYNSLSFHLPVGIRYTLPSKFISPYLQAGVGFNFILQDWHMIITSNQIPAPYPNLVEKRGWLVQNMGYSAVGFELKKWGLFVPFIEYRTSKNLLFQWQIESTISTTQHLILTGLKF
jgi:hypothetical protein